MILDFRENGKDSSVPVYVFCVYTARCTTYMGFCDCLVQPNTGACKQCPQMLAYMGRLLQYICSS